MKKSQRSFAVEYKSSRRRTDAKPNSVWGDLDLKSVARDVERSLTPMLSNNPAVIERDGECPPPNANLILPTLTAPAATSKAVADTQEISMADEHDMAANADTTANADALPNADVPAAVRAESAPKKQRKPRMKKASSDMTGADTAVGLDGSQGVKRRGRKPKTLGGAAASTLEPVRRSSKYEEAAAVEATSAGDEMADLLQLEEENQRLRKLLAEKLRAENADLRKKLKLD
ncbi:transcriptional regulator [Pseudorhizobium endolithicum]|nr:transcriptional regulator [Pseudorhizobium endolithicum]